MGYPIHSNIFRDDSENSQYLRSFPIQVAVLFSPRDQNFIDAFKELFVELDKITGKYVVYFAFLDPPSEWIEEARERDVWLEYWRQKPIGFNFDDRMLVSELVRQFGLQWEDLPVLVISTNLWNMEYITIRTSPFYILDQIASLKSLVEHASEKDELDFGKIMNFLQDRYSYPAHYHPPKFDRRLSLARFFGILEESTPLFLTPEWINISKRNLYFQIKQAADDLRRSTYQVQTESPLFELPGIDQFLSGLISDLIPFVAVKERTGSENRNYSSEERLGLLIDNFTSDLQEHKDILDEFDDETFTMLDRGLRIARSMSDPEFLRPILNSDKRQRPPLEEFSPAGIDLWKAFEREINKSIVQAFRCARKIDMPKYFSRFMPNFRGKDRIIYRINDQTKNKSVNINQQDWEDPNGDRHRFITMGNAFHCTNVMIGNSAEDFDDVIRICLGRSLLPQAFLDDWQRIFQIRNPHSHTELLSKKDFRELADCVLNCQNLEILMKIKKALSR